MIAANVEFTPISSQKFQGLIREMQKTTKAEMPKVVRNTGRDFCRFAAKFTPLAKRLTEGDFRSDEGYFIRIQHKHTKRIVSFIGTKEQFDNARVGRGKRKLRRKPGQYPKGRGYARIGWYKALISLGVDIRLKGAKASIEGINAAGDFVDGLNRKSPYVDIINQVPYIEKLDRGGMGQAPYHIMGRAMAATGYAMEKTLTKLARRMAANWYK